MFKAKQNIEVSSMPNKILKYFLVFKHYYNLQFKHYFNLQRVTHGHSRSHGSVDKLCCALAVTASIKYCDTGVECDVCGRDGCKVGTCLVV